VSCADSIFILTEILPQKNARNTWMRIHFVYFLCDPGFLLWPIHLRLKSFWLRDKRPNLAQHEGAGLAGGTPTRATETVALLEASEAGLVGAVNDDV
jgi:hypothetical protein